MADKSFYLALNEMITYTFEIFLAFIGPYFSLF